MKLGWLTEILLVAASLFAVFLFLEGLIRGSGWRPDVIDCLCKLVPVIVATAIPPRYPKSDGKP